MTQREKRIAMYSDAISEGREIPYELADDAAALSKYEDWEWDDIVNDDEDDSDFQSLD